MKAEATFTKNRLVSIFSAACLYSITQIPLVGPSASLSLHGVDIVARLDRGLKNGVTDDGQKVHLAGKLATLYFYPGVAFGQYLGNQFK